MAHKVEIVVLEDGAEVELSYHLSEETMFGWFLDMDSVAEKGWTTDTDSLTFSNYL